MEEGAIAADVLYADRNGDVQVVLGPERLVDLVYDLWRRWKEAWREWRVMSFVIGADDHFTIDVTYPDELDEQEDVTDRRPRAIERYFGRVNVTEPDLEVEDGS